ncbi:MAG: hypothetical protein AAF394_05465 [Planctomycetota bacterium]
MNNNRKLVILGDRTANEVLESAQLGHGSEFASITKLYFAPESFNNEATDLESDVEEVFYQVGVANIALKQEIIAACESRGWKAFSIVHPQAVVSPSASIGEGTYLGPLCVVSSNAKVGNHCIVHIQSTVGHDAIVEDLCAVLPGAKLSGKVHVSARSLVGSNAFVAAGITIGEDSQVDALCYLAQDLAPQHIASPRTTKPLKRVDI